MASHFGSFAAFLTFTYLEPIGPLFRWEKTTQAPGSVPGIVDKLYRDSFMVYIAMGVLAGAWWTTSALLNCSESILSMVNELRMLRCSGATARGRARGTAEMERRGTWQMSRWLGLRLRWLHREKLEGLLELLQDATGHRSCLILVGFRFCNALCM